MLRILILINRLRGVQTAEKKSNEETDPNLGLGFHGLGDSLTVYVVQKHAAPATRMSVAWLVDRQNFKQWFGPVDFAEICSSDRRRPRLVIALESFYVLHFEEFSHNSGAHRTQTVERLYVGRDADLIVNALA